MHRPFYTLYPYTSMPLIPVTHCFFMPVKGSSIISLEIEFAALAISVSDLVHCFTIEQAAVHHGVTHRFGIVDVVKRVFVEDDEVGQFSFFERADVVIKAKIVRAIDGSAL